MTLLYGLAAMNDEVTELHQESLKNGGNNDTGKDALIALLGGIDHILAFFLQQRALDRSQLTALRAILSSKRMLRAWPPSVEEMDDILDEIEQTNAATNHAKLEVCEPEFGQSQSPINIMSCCNNTTTMTMPDEEFEMNPLRFNYPSKVNQCTILNNGHTVQVNIDASQKCTLSIHGKTFTLKQFHFHTPSEHTIDSKQYEMEMHLVHLNEANEIAVLGFIFALQQRYQRPKLQLTKSRAHLVLSSQKKSMIKTTTSSLKVMAESDDETSDDLDTDDEWDAEDTVVKNTKMNKKRNDFLAQFWDELPGQKTEQDIPLKSAISFDYLFETASQTFSKNVETNEIEIDMEIFEYMGSLTTPPYTEGVQWLVSKKTHFISQEQLRKLSECWNNTNNARAVQKYCGRTVSLRSKSSLRVVT
eukprot:453683_1